MGSNLSINSVNNSGTLYFNASSKDWLSWESFPI